MKAKILNVSLVLFLFVVLNSCSVLLEEDLSSQEMIIFMPFDGQQTNQVNQTFWWAYMEGAIEYNIQILKPGFFNPEELIADTSVTGNKFDITLSPGEYEWCVIAWNNYSATDCIIYKLTVLDVPDNESSEE